MNRRPDRGSTLIELLISITIVGMILVIIMGAFRIGIRAWETGERDIEQSQRQQIVLSMLKRQLASACLQPVAIEGGDPFIFSGDEKTVDFISGVSVVPGEDVGKVRVTYRIRRDGSADGYLLEIAERSFLSGGLDQTIDELDDDRIYEIMGNIHDIRFEYLKTAVSEETSDWESLWENSPDAGLPAAVKCVLQLDENAPPVTMIARIFSQKDIS
jgi:general secretion pathway protein J